MMDKEKDYKEEYGTEVRITHLHPDLFAQLKVYWYYDCVPVPNSNDPLSYMVFAKQIQDAMTFFGPQSLNVKKLKHRFSVLTGNDFDTWFLNEQEMALQNAMNPPAPGTPPGTPPATTPGPIPGKPTGAGPSIADVLQGGNPAQKLGSLMR